MRLTQAKAYVMVADVCLSDSSAAATPTVAASLAVLAGIAAADAATCCRIGQRSRDQQHSKAVEVVAAIEPGGRSMASLYGDLLAAKDDSHYGLSLVTSTKAETMVRKANRLVAWADQLVSW